MPTARTQSLVALTLTTAFSVLLTGCGMSNLAEKSSEKLVTGEVYGGQQAISGSTVQLYAVGTASDGSAATALITKTAVTTSDGTGNASNSNANAGNDYNALPTGAFTIGGDFTCPTASSPVTATQVYIVATGGNPGLTSGTNNSAIAMMAALGPCAGITSSTHIHLDELTTIGSLAPVAAYMNSIPTLGSGTSDAAQFLAALGEVADYTDTSIGVVPGPSLPSGYYASSVEIQTLGAVISACINSAGGTAGQNNSCGNLFSLTTPPSGTAPTDVIGATLTILKYPSQNVCPIFDLLPPNGPFQPTLSSCPTNWELPILPIAATPVISPGTGSYTGAQSVSITDATANSSIYYTTNGTTPTSASTPYTGPFEVSSSSTVQAVAVASGYAVSGVASATYTLGAAGAPAQLAFLVQPANTAINTAIAPSIQVAIEDAAGHIVGTASNSVTLALSPNPGSATVSGTATATAVNGIATFSNLSLNVVGTGYGFTASSAGLTPASSTTFNITLPVITVTLPNTLVGIGSTLPGTFTLGQAAPSGGLTVNLASNATSDVTISPATVTVAQGATSGSFTYTCVAVATASLSASATGYVTGAAAVTGTETYISLGMLPTIAPSQTSSLALSLGQSAGSNGVTVSFTSSNTAVATVTPSVFIPSGFKVGAENPQITGTGYGTTTITASAPGYAPDIRTVTVSLTTSLTQGVSVPTNSPQTMTLTLSAGAPTGGLTFTLMSSNTSYATVPATLTIPAGSASGTFTVTGVAPGTATISASYPGLTTATSSVTVTSPTINLLTGQDITTTGVGLYASDLAYLSSNPPSPITLTMTSSNPSVALLSSNAAVLGSGTITFTNYSGGYLHFQIQGQAVGTSTLTMSAPGYTSYTATITVMPSGLVVAGTLSTTTFSGTASVSVTAAILNPGTLTYSNNCNASYYQCAVGPNPVTIAVTSSNTAVGTISSSPVTIAAGSVSGTTNFQPVSAGTSTIALGTQPAGFSATTSSGYLSGTATVTAPTPSFGPYASTYNGVGLYTAVFDASLGGTAPSGGITVTVTSSNPSAVLLSTTPSALGSASITLNNVTNTIPQYYVQGVAQGTSTITMSAPGVNNATETVTVYPVGIILSGGNFSTTTLIGSTGVVAQVELLNSSTLANQNSCSGINSLNGPPPCAVGPGSVTFAVTSSNTAVGTISTSPITIPAGSTSASTNFTPLTAGTTTLSISSQPTGFSTSTSTNAVSITATVTQPTATTGFGTIPLGVGLYELILGSSLGGTEPSPVTVTVTSSNPSVLLLSTDPSSLGSASLTFTNVTTGTPRYYAQGVGQGTSTVTVSAPGVNNGTSTVNVYPSGLVSNNLAFSTTTFSSPNSISVGAAVLNPGTLSLATFCQGIGSNNGGYPCAVGPGSATIAVTSSNTAVGTISSSTITIPAGSYSASTTFTPSTSGTTTIALGMQPTGFSATSSTSYLSGTATVSAPTPSFSGTTPIGVGLYEQANVSFGATAPSPVAATISSSNPSVAVLSSTNSAPGSGTLSFNNLTTVTPAFYIQGLSVGSTVLTVTIPGFNNATVTITVDPSGLIFSGSSDVFTTTTSSSPSVITVSAALLTPGTLTYLGTCSGSTGNSSYGCSVGPNAASIPVISSNTSTGTITTSPVTLSVGSYSATTTFNPLAAGTSTLSLGTQPTGFSATASGGTYLSGTATVSH